MKQDIDEAKWSSEDTVLLRRWVDSTSESVLGLIKIAKEMSSRIERLERSLYGMTTSLVQVLSVPPEGNEEGDEDKDEPAATH